MTQQTERDALRKLAEAATPGPWAFGTFHRLLVVQTDKHGYADKHSAIADIGAGSIPWDATADSMQEYNDAEYIAAANPAAVITLLDQLQSQAERIKELEEEIGGWREDQKENIGVAFALQREVNKITSERDELREKYTDTYWALDDAARENTSLRAQLTEIAATEPVASHYFDIEGNLYTAHRAKFLRPSLNGLTPLFTRPVPAKDVDASMIKLPEPDDTYCGVNYYTESQLKQAVRDALDALKDVAQTLAWMQHGKCRGFSDGLLTTDEALDKARTALAKYKGAKQ